MNGQSKIFLLCLFLAMALMISAWELYNWWQANRFRKGAPPYVGWWFDEDGNDIDHIMTNKEEL